MRKNGRARPENGNFSKTQKLLGELRKVPKTDFVKLKIVFFGR